MKKNNCNKSMELQEIIKSTAKYEYIDLEHILE